ncbi:hypothetical protein [Polaribacter uvawellassae]|uniref:hypothetical protein n=1 Tax=Polaribacter uvawellassae TaxID=3133495 RepID=UPI003219EF53
MTIDEIFKKEEISARSYHVCKDSRLNSVKELKEYYYKRKSFIHLQNCGRKSNEELIEICNKYQGEHFENIETEIKKENSLKTIISDLTRVQREVINSFILVNTNSLSVRSQNAILSYLNQNLKVKNFATKILIPNSFKLNKLKNVGSKSIRELDVYITIIKEYLIEVSQSEDEKKLISLKNKLLIQRTYSISKIPSEILETESIFIIANFLLNENAFFEKDRTDILKNALKVYLNQKELTLEEISKKVNLTSERVRQIRKFLVDSLFDQLLFLKNFNDDINQKYNIDTNLNQIIIEDNVFERINDINNVSFSKEFIFFILYTYISDSHKLLGDIQDVLLPQYFKVRNRHNWKNFYLIEKDIVKEIDFNAIANDIDNRISDKIIESYSFNFKSYLSRFLTNNNIDFLDLVFPIAENIINQEFELHLDLNENLIFKRNTKKQAHEYAFEALEHLGKPSKVKEIFEKILELYPNYNTDEPKVRVSMKRKNGFVPIGRKSVFGLKKWEKELDNFKGGTIRTISEEFLLNFNEPQHKKVIEKYVKQYRPKTNANSIYNNLYIDESNTFIFYENYYIGLTSKKYSNNFKILTKTASPTRQTWEESLEVLKEFISKEERLPYSSGCSKSEEKLYCWFNIQKRKCYDGKLEKEKEHLIIEIDNMFPQINGKRRSNSSEKYEELIAFVKSNLRLPSASKNGEENLYQFFYKQRKLFDKDKLEAKEEIQFIEVAKLLQNIKYENKGN